MASIARWKAVALTADRFSCKESTFFKPSLNRRVINIIIVEPAFQRCPTLCLLDQGEVNHLPSLTSVCYFQVNTVSYFGVKLDSFIVKTSILNGNVRFSSVFVSVTVYPSGNPFRWSKQENYRVSLSLQHQLLPFDLPCISQSYQST